MVIERAYRARIEDLWAEHSIFCSRAKLGFTAFTDAERAATPEVRKRMLKLADDEPSATLNAVTLCAPDALAVEDQV